jgi:hypothetical protein
VLTSGSRSLTAYRDETGPPVTSARDE